MPVTVVVDSDGIATEAGGWENVGITALASTKHLPSILLDLQCFLWLLLVSFILLFVWVALFAKGDGFGLSGYLWVGENGFMVFHLSSMYAFILLTSDGNGFTCEPKRLHIKDCVAQSLL